jgi:exodeoxyribonuclease VII large subunit
LNIGKKYDLIAIVRGGGSQLDFSAFDTYDLGLKIATFPIPIIAGIGHERNVSIADLMCFSSLKTPTKAASFIIEHNTVFEQQIERLKARLVYVADGIIQSSKNNIERTAVALKNAAIIFFKDKHNALNQKSLTIKLLDPSNVLARGYAILQNKNGIIMQAHKLKKGDKITATTKDAVVNLITEDITKI